MSHQKCSMLHFVAASFDSCRTNRVDSVCGVAWIPLCARDGSGIAWGRGEGRPRYVVSTQCAVGLSIRRCDERFPYLDQKNHIYIYIYILYKQYSLLHL